MSTDARDRFEEFLRLKSQAVEKWTPLAELEVVHARLHAVAADFVPVFVGSEEAFFLGEYLAARRRAAQLLEQNGGNADKQFLVEALKRYADPEAYDLPILDLDAYSYLLEAHARHPHIDTLLPMLQEGATHEQVIDAALAYEPIRL